MAATVKVWSGSAWVTKPVKVWSGSAWVAKPLKFWNGSAWIGPSGGAIVAPTFRSLANTSYAARTQTDITKPSGVTTNDIMIAFIVLARAGSAPTNPTPPSGFTQIGTFTSVVDSGSFNGKCGLFWKRATGSEPATYTFTQDVSYSTQGLVMAYSGCTTSGSPVDVFAQTSGNSTGAGPTLTATGVTTTQANDMLVWAGHNWDGSGALTPPTGMTERLDSLAYAADQVIATASATGTRTQTQASSSNPFSVFLIALKGT